MAGQRLHLLPFLQTLRLFGLLSLCLEGTQQAVKCFLVVVMVFPASEITDMAHPTDISSPGLSCPCHRLIQFDWKEYQLFPPTFLLEGGLYFLLDPLAF